VPVVCKPAVALPTNVELDRDMLKSEVVRFLGEDFPRLKAIQRIVDNSGVERRYLCRSLSDILEQKGMAETNDMYIEACKDLGERAAAEALENSGLKPEDIDLIITTSCTGFMIPSLDAHLIPKLGMRRDCVRLPITELGCAAGAVAISRARDFIAARPGSNVLIVAVELCSLCFQPEDFTMQAIVGSLLFGDGAAAAVVRAEGGSGFDVEVSGQYLFEDSWRYMGFDVRDTGLHLILDKDVPGAVERQIAPVMHRFLDENDEKPDFFCLHPGGRKLMDNIEKAFDLSDRDLWASRRCLAEVGNLSSASVLVVLKNLFDDPPAEGDRGFLAAFGPGFSVEMSLGTWRA
jgi:predicted naringenin-chalcone synthase